MYSSTTKTPVQAPVQPSYLWWIALKDVRYRHLPSSIPTEINGLLSFNHNKQKVELLVVAKPLQTLHVYKFTFTLFTNRRIDLLQEC